MAVPEASRRRDRERSRQAILDAAEALFAEVGHDGVSLAEIGARAGVSRATPGYFFGSKEDLYAAVLARLFAARSAALTPAFAPLEQWARGRPGEQPESLADALERAIDGYLGFLRARPAFVALSQREAVGGGGRLAATPHESPVAENALRALRRVAPRHGLRRFDVDQVLIAFLALCYFPLAHRGTLLRSLGLDADSPGFARAHRRQVLDVLLHLLVEGR